MASRPVNVDPRQPVLLQPVQIPKPWGQEIWYTGMEARGESGVWVDDRTLPLSRYLQHDPAQLTNHSDVLLLKVLDPKPEAVLGDLYFEVHEEKQEVYIVTHVDASAWPGGVGGIRFGMNQVKRQAFDSDADFRQAYLDSVQTYEKIRRQIDEQGADISAAEEAGARQAMDEFAHLRQLQVGDVVRVPTWTPHSLLHGVRVVEFQTPTYERFIISFAQQVVTQDHWDSDHAVAHMHIDAPTAESFEQVASGVERIARFDEFNVWRVDLRTAAPLALPSHIPYAVAMCLSESVRLGRLNLSAEEACFIPRAALPHTRMQGTGRVLIAAPDL